MVDESLASALGVSALTLPLCLAEIWTSGPSMLKPEENRRCIIAFSMVCRDRQIAPELATKLISEWSGNAILTANEIESVYNSDAQLTCEWIQKSDYIYQNCEKTYCDYNVWRKDFTFVKRENKKKAIEAVNQKIEDDSEEKESLATKLAKLARKNCSNDLWHTPDGVAYITICINNHKEYKRISSKPIKAWLSRLASDFLLETPSGQVINSVISLLEGIALYDGKEYELHVRKAELNGKIYVDIGDSNWNVIEISKEGWRVVQDCPIRFYRPKSLMPLPMPEAGGDVKDFKKIVNISDEDTWIRYTAWLCQAFWCRGPYVHLHVRGPQGSAKTGLAENTKALIDPSRAPKRHLPKTPRDLMMACQNEAVPSFDNVSEFSDEIADTICIVSTGGSSAARELYTDSDEAIIYSKNPIIMNGIADPSQRGDLIDRLMILDLNSIPEEDRISEKVMRARLAEYGPKLLGIILDATVTGLLNVDNVHLSGSPRMADFAQWAVACSQIMGWEPDKFISIYRESRQEAQQEMAETNRLMRAIARLAEVKMKWQGTSTELLGELNTQEHVLPGYEPEDWPRIAQNAGTAVRRLVQPAESQGVIIRFFRNAGKNKIEIQLSKEKQMTIGVPCVGSSEKVHKENANGVTCVTCVSFLKERLVYRKKREETQKVYNKEFFENEGTQGTQERPIPEIDHPSLHKGTQPSLHTIYVLAEIEQFSGIDGRTYGPFKRDDVASLPILHAKNLAEKKFARLINTTE